MNTQQPVYGTVFLCIQYKRDKRGDHLISENPALLSTIKEENQTSYGLMLSRWNSVKGFKAYFYIPMSSTHHRRGPARAVTQSFERHSLFGNQYQSQPAAAKSARNRGRETKQEERRIKVM